MASLLGTYFDRFKLVKALMVVILMATTYDYVSGRLWALSVIRSNDLQSLTEAKEFSIYDIKFRDVLRNCEDAVIIEGQGAAILSCDPGRDQWNTVMGTASKNTSAIPAGGLFLYRYDESKHPSNHGIFRIELQHYADENEFHPLGIEYHQSSYTLLISNHHFEGSRIEIFKLDIISHKPVAKHISTIMHPLIRTPNSISALSEHEFFFSNDHYFRVLENPMLAKTETYGAIPLGSIVYVNMHSESIFSLKSIVNMPYPNGITLLNASMLAVASTSSCEFRLYKIGYDKELELSSTVRVPFMPDNLSIDQKGKLLISGHPHPPSLEKMVKQRAKCLESISADRSKCHIMGVPSWVIEWTEEQGIKTLYRTAGEFGSSATTVRDYDYGLGLITGLYESGILVWRD